MDIFNEYLKRQAIYPLHRSQAIRKTWAFSQQNIEQIAIIIIGAGSSHPIQKKDPTRQLITYHNFQQRINPTLPRLQHLNCFCQTLTNCKWRMKHFKFYIKESPQRNCQPTCQKQTATTYNSLPKDFSKAKIVWVELMTLTPLNGTLPTRKVQKRSHVWSTWQHFWWSQCDTENTSKFLLCTSDQRSSNPSKNTKISASDANNGKSLLTRKCLFCFLQFQKDQTLGYTQIYLVQW